MGRLLTGLGGAFGLAWLWRFLRRGRPATQPPVADPVGDPAAELRAKLEQARGAEDDRDEFDAAEGQPVDEVERPPPTGSDTEQQGEQPLSLDERRRAIHEKAQQALGEMNRPGENE